MASNNDDAYSQAVASGKYQRARELRCKYDHVRLYWEDDVTRRFLAPSLQKLIQERGKNGRGIRILDLGCGSGDGYELLMKIPEPDANLDTQHNSVLTEDTLAGYRGIELNKDLLAQNVERWGENAKMDCVWGDFSQGLPEQAGSDPYDLYFASYGALSHLHEDQTIELLSDICRQAEDGALIMGDWLGRYSYEWQQLWQNHCDEEQWMDYVISYIYPPEQRDQMELASLQLRLLSRDEIERMVTRVCEQTGISLTIDTMFDRSLFVGRHIETGDYNAHLKTQLRQTVNSLFERNQRTNLESLVVNYHPQPDFPAANQFFSRYHQCWNALVHCTMEGLRDYEQPVAPDVELEQEADAHLLNNLKNHLMRVIHESRTWTYDDPRANIIEPELGYALRHLEMTMQQGMGNGHGIVAIMHVNK